MQQHVSTLSCPAPASGTAIPKPSKVQGLGLCVDLSPELGERDIKRRLDGAHGRPGRVCLAVLDPARGIDGDPGSVRDRLLGMAARLAKRAKDLGKLGIYSSTWRHPLRLANGAT